MRRHTSSVFTLAAEKPGPEVIKLFSCSTQLNMKFQLLLKYRRIKKCLALCLSDVVFIMLMNEGLDGV